MNDQQQDTARAASYLATQQRMDLRGFGATRTGKTRAGKLNCNPPNVQCGNRCIPPNWDCRLKGQGTNSDLSAHKTDPLAGIASLQRGSKDIVQGIARVNPAQVQRGRNSLIRGAVKLTPGDNLERKKRLKKQLNDVSRPLGAVIGVTLVGLSAHIGLKRGFPAYRRGVGADVDGAAARAVDSLLDSIPGFAGSRAARRAAGAQAAGAVASSVLSGQAMERTRAATSGNLGRIGPLSFRPNAANTESSGLVDSLNRLQADARDGNSSYDSWRQSAVETLYGATNPGTRPNGQRGSIFSEHAANEFLVSKFRLQNAGVVGTRGGDSMAARNTLVDSQLSQRLGQWGQSLRNDMQVRRFVNERGVIEDEQISRYIREVAGTTINPSFAGMNRDQRNQATAEAHRLMASAIRGDRLVNEARSMRRKLVEQYDSYFSDVAQGMRRNAAASDSPFGDGLTGLARYVTRTTGQTTQILSRDHADLILRNHFHTRVMQLKNDYSIGETTARRIAQQLSRSPDLPDADSAYRILNANGFPRLSRGSAVTGQAPKRLRNQTELIRDILNRPGNEGMSRAAAQREARRLIALRGRRGDAAETQSVGKPCGASHIPKAHECRKGAAAAPAPAASSSSAGRTAATLAAGAAIGAAGLLAYRNRATLVPNLSQSTIQGLSSAQVKAGLDKLPERFREPARQLVGDAKRAAAFMALRAQGSQIRAVDVANNFSTWVTPNGTHLSVGSVGDSLLTFGAERKGNVGKFPQYGLGFTIDTQYDAKGGMPSKQAKQLIRTTKAMYRAQLEMLPENAFLFAVPHKDDGKGGKRKSIYEGMGFKAIPGLKTDRLWALKNQGKFTEIPESQFDALRSMIRGDAAEPAGKAPLTERVSQSPPATAAPAPTT